MPERERFWEGLLTTSKAVAFLVEEADGEEEIRTTIEDYGSQRFVQEWWRSGGSLVVFLATNYFQSLGDIRRGLVAYGSFQRYLNSVTDLARDEVGLVWLEVAGLKPEIRTFRAFIAGELSLMEDDVAVRERLGNLAGDADRERVVSYLYTLITELLSLDDEQIGKLRAARARSRGDRASERLFVS